MDPPQTPDREAISRMAESSLTAATLVRASIQLLNEASRAFYRADDNAWESVEQVLITLQTRVLRGR